MGEWVRFWIVAAVLACGIIAFVMEIIGLFRFGFVMNRMHASGIGDSFGLGCVVLSMIIASGFNLVSLKLLLLVMFMWLTSPVSTHFLSRIEINTNPFIMRHVRFVPDKDGKDSNGN